MNRTVGCFDQDRISCSVNVYIIAVHSLIGLENQSSAWTKRHQFSDIRFVLIIRLCDCRRAAPIPKLEASHMAFRVDMLPELIWA